MTDEDLRGAIKRHDDRHRVILEFLGRIEIKLNELGNELKYVEQRISLLSQQVDDQRKYSPED